MPFIDTRVTVKLTDEQKEAIKTEFGKALPIINKTEAYLMVGIQDGYDLWFAGEKLEKGAFVGVNVFRDIDPACGDLTAAICEILERVAGIPGDRVYVKYHGVWDWGWNGKNFGK